MKKSIKNLAVLLLAGLVLGFAGCNSESEDDWSNDLIKVTGGTITVAAYTNNYTGVFPVGRTVTLSDFYMSKYEVPRQSTRK